MTRYVLLTRDLPPARVGGVASWVDDLATALVQAGRSVLVVVERRSLGDGSSRSYPVRAAAGRSWQRWQGAWMALATRDLWHDPSVVFIGATWPLVAGLARVRVAGRLFAGVHGSDVTRHPPSPGHLARMAGQVTFLPVSHFLRRVLLHHGAPSDAAVVLPWPLSDPPAPLLPARGPHLVLAARLVDGKGVDDAVVLASRLARPLVVVGEGPARAQGEQVATRLGVSVDWRGRLDRTQTRAVLATAAAVVLPSTADSREGLGLTALEAAAAGVPAIGRTVGGIPEAVGPGVCLPADSSMADVDLTSVSALLADPRAAGAARAFVAAHHSPAAALAVLDRCIQGASDPEQSP